MVYDYANQAVLLFGGVGTQFYNDTWLWDGRTWRQVGVGAAPPARDLHGLASDPIRQRVVLYGGHNGLGLNDTWEWDGVRWTPMNPLNSPPPLYLFGMAFDLQSQSAAVASGTAAQTNTVWLWNGQDWRAVSGNGFDPQIVEEAVLLEDPIGGGLLMYGGETRNSQPVPNVYRWNGQGWQLLATHPLGAAHEAAEVDVARGKLVFPWTVLKPAYELDLRTGTWDTVVPLAVPLFQSYSSVSGPCFLSWRDQFLVFTHGTGETWWFDDAGWTRASGPVFLNWPTTMVAHPGGQRVLAWDRLALHQFDGTAWQTVPPPPPGHMRTFIPCAYDAVRDAVLVVERQLQGLVVWGWHPAGGWTLLDNNGPPSTTFSHAFGSFDVARNRLIYLETHGSEQCTVFEWDGSNWTTQVQPVGRLRSALEYVPGLGCLYLTSQRPNSSRPTQWIWDGSSMQPLQTPTAVEMEWSDRAVYDPNHHRLRMIAGRYVGWVPEFWDLRPHALSATELDPAPGSRVTLDFDSAANPGEFWITGFSTMSRPGIPLFPAQPYGVRTLDLGLDLLLPLSVHWGIGGLLDPQGRGRAFLTVPNLPFLDGLVLHSQGVTLGQQGIGHISNPLRFTVTR